MWFSIHYFQVKTLQKNYTNYKKPCRFTVERTNTLQFMTRQFFQFCSLAGAANIYNFVLSCMTSSSHSEERTLLNKLCFGYSQKCDFFQEDNGLFLKFCNSSQSGIEAQRQLGTSVSSKVISRNRAAIAKQNFQVCHDAIAKEFTILLMIDNYHNIHNIRRPHVYHHHQNCFSRQETG